VADHARLETNKAIKKKRIFKINLTF